MTRSNDARETRDVPPERSWMDLALAAYVEPLARGRAVLFVGDPQSPAAGRLGEVAARLEVVASSSRQRPSRAGRGTLRSHAESGEWDLVWLGDAANVVGDASQLREIAEALSSRGAAIFGLDGDVASYEAGYQSLRGHFEHVRMLGQAPFAGQSIVDFAGAQRDPGLSFDGSLVGDAGSAPHRFVAVCSARAVSLEPHTIVQTPIEQSASSSEARRDLDAARARLEHSERRLEQAQREIARSGQKLDELRHELARAQAGLAEAVQRAEAEGARAAELAARLETAEGALRAAERELAEVAASEDAAAEMVELERALHECAKENVALREELSRRAVLVRDILETRAPAAASTPTPLSADVEAELASLREALVAAQRRAVDAEAARAAAVFARDEAVEAEARARSALQNDVAQHAREAGRARGLLSRVAELEELRGLLEARIELLHSDLRDARQQIREAQREAELARERYELAVATARAMERGEASAASAERGPTPSSDERLRAELTAAEQALADARQEAARLRTELELLASQGARERAETTGRVAELEATLAAERAAFEGRVEAVARAEAARVEGLEGEVSGLRWLVADLEAARAALATRPLPPDTHRDLEAAQGQLERLKEAHQAEVALRQMTLARADAETARAIELSQRVLALDALVARLQSALVQETDRAATARQALRAVEQRLAEAVAARDALEAMQVVRLGEERKQTEALEARLARSEASLALARDVQEVLRAAVTEARALLADASARLPAGSPGVGGTDPTMRDRVEEMRRAIEDRDLLLRSLTAQLQDRDDRIRGLEQTLRGQARGAGDADTLRASVAERDERIARLRAELDEARATLARLEAGQGSQRERDAELRRLQGALADREAKLTALEARAMAAERDHREMRDTFAAARARLEALLGDTRGRADTGEHVAELVRLLRRF